MIYRFHLGIFGQCIYVYIVPLKLYILSQNMIFPNHNQVVFVP